MGNDVSNNNNYDNILNDIEINNNQNNNQNKLTTINNNNNNNNFNDNINQYYEEEEKENIITQEDNYTNDDDFLINNQQVDDNVGYRILQIHSNGPAASGGFICWFDFIVACNDIRLNIEDDSFINEINKYKNQKMKLLVYNSKNMSLREIYIIPNDSWGGNGALGLTIKFDNFQGAIEEVIHILDVIPYSPAFYAGLQPYTDYILGTPHSIFQDLDELYDLIHTAESINKSLPIYVYSSDTDEIKLTKIFPTLNWKGNQNDSLLGCDVGYGYLHQIPSKCRKSLGKNGMFNMNDNDNNIHNNNNNNNNNNNEDFNNEFNNNNNNINNNNDNTNDIIINNINYGKGLNIPVSTNLGNGTIISENNENGSVMVKLNWNLDNNALIIAKYLNNNVERYSINTKNQNQNNNNNNNNNIKKKKKKNTLNSDDVSLLVNMY